MLLLLAAALSVPAAVQVPQGRFREWHSSQKERLRFISGGVSVQVEPLPCVPAAPSETCRYDGYNNQGVVTVSAPGQAPVRVVTDRQSMYARIAVVRFDKRDRQPGVVIESQYGGSGGILTTQLLVPTETGNRVILLDRAGGGYLQRQLADGPADLSGDGVIDLVYADGRFDSVFGCNACTPRPPIVFAVRGGRLVDESRQPGVRAVYRRDLVRPRAICLSDQSDRNGACAAWMADAARAGGFAQAWAAMLLHYDGRAPERWPVRTGAAVGTFPDSLRAFLRRTGYLPS